MKHPVTEPRMARTAVTHGPVPGPPATIGNVLQCIRVAARCAGMTTIGFLARTAFNALVMMPRLFRGTEPIPLKVMFLPLAAMHRVLSWRLDGLDTNALLEGILFQAVLVQTDWDFKKAREKQSLSRVVSCTLSAFRGVGRYQSHAIETDRDTRFQYVVTRCRLTAALGELGLHNLAPVICTATRAYWEHSLDGSHLSFERSEPTIGRGGTCCRVRFNRASCRSHNQDVRKMSVKNTYTHISDR